MDLPFIASIYARRKSGHFYPYGEFLNQWATHGTPLKTGFALPYDHFIVIGLDEAVQGASGCSIDASVHLIQALEKSLTLPLGQNERLLSSRGRNHLHSPKRL